MNKTLLWFRIIRPQTLFASLVPVLVALRIGGCNDSITAVCTVICALLLQILSNLINDYYDYVRGTDKAGRVGFKRALAEGEVTKSTMKKACLIVAIAAIVIGSWLVAVGGWPIVVIGLTALLFAWLYTATSHSLSYLGIADVFVFLYYGVIASIGTELLQTCSGYWLTEGWKMGVCTLPVFCGGAVSGLISMCVLIINNLRDIDDDRRVGKRTLPVRFGKHFTEGLMLCLIIMMPVFATHALGKLSILFVLTLIIPMLGIWISVVKAQGNQFNKCLLFTGLYNVFYYILLLIVL